MEKEGEGSTVLKIFADNQELKGHDSKMESLKCTTICIIRISILERINEMNLKLKHPYLDLNEGVKLLIFISTPTEASI